MTKRLAAGAPHLVLALIGCLATASAAPTGRLEVAGGSLAGTFAAIPAVGEGTRDTFLWQSPRFATPFEFRIGEVTGITFPVAEPAAAPPGSVVHLRGGDALPAEIESLDNDALVVSTAGPGGPQRLTIARDEVTAIARAGGGGSYSGPSGLTGWEQTPPGSWREEAGRILTDRAGATVTRDVSAPMRARYTIRLSRRRAAEFRIVVAAAERPADDGYVLQAVGVDGSSTLMLVRRAGGRAAIEPLPATPWQGDTLEVVLFVDQQRGRLAAILPAAEDAEARRVFEVTLAPPVEAERSGRVRLELTTGQICLERLEVTPWRGDVPTLRDAAETTILTRTETLAGYTVASFDAHDGTYVVSRGGETKRVPAADVEEIRFPDRDAPVAEPALRLVRSDRGAISGDLVRVDEQAVWLRRRGIDADVAVPHDAILSLFSRRATPPSGEEPAGRVGTLVAGDDRVRGWIVEDAEGGVAWRPLGSTTAATFAGGAIDAEIEYVPRPPGKRRGADTEVGGIGGIVNRDPDGFFVVAMMTADGAASRDGRIQAGDRIMAVAPSERSIFVDTKDLDNETVTHLLRGRVGTVVRMKLTDSLGANPRVIDLTRARIQVAGREILDAALEAHVRLARAPEPEGEWPADFPAFVVLRSGDVAPCRIESIDAESVILRTPLAGGADAGTTRVPATLVKAVELIPAAGRREIDKTLRDRLLTLPRMQRDRPPTHLLRLVDGDYLRGRLVGVDDATVTFEVLDVVKQLPRQQVARLIWLHPESTGDGVEATPAAAEAEGLVVQGVAADDRRFTLVAQGVVGNELRGRSRAFGESTIDLARVDRLLIGGAIGGDVDDLPFSQWVLKPAPEPRALGKPADK